MAGVRETARAKKELDPQAGGAVDFDLASLFPKPPKGFTQGPFPKQRLVYVWLKTGAAQGGGIVYQGGKGCAKSICGAAADILVHHVPEWQGCRTLIGRESYPSLLTSTWDEYRQMLERMPQRLIRRVSQPSTNTMGFVEWAVGGVTLICSLSDSRTWESANLGFAWVDEGHLQEERVIEALSSRLRQDPGPRTMLITTNPAGRNWIHRWANPKSKKRLPHWLWLESNMFENPALSRDYIARMEAKYPPGSIGHKRWILGQSVALEGTIFTEIFDPDPSACIHVVPAGIELPWEWRRGRGLDWGIDNPTVALWAAYSPEREWWVYRLHKDRMKPASWHARQIVELEEGENIHWTPADPEIFRRTHTDEYQNLFSTADQFMEAGCIVTSATNDRDLGLDLVWEHITVDPEKIHPVTLKKGSPRLFILNNESTQPLIECLESLQWKPEPMTGGADSPDDVRKRHDHEYDALRYLIAEQPEAKPKAPVRRGRPAPRGLQGYRGY